MGDRCDLTLTFREKDTTTLGKYLAGSTDKTWWDTENTSPAEGILEVAVEEVNYGWYRELGLAAAAHIPFIGWHGAGSEYRAHQLVGCEGKYYEVVVDALDAFVVILDANLSIPRGVRGHIKLFQAAKTKILKLFGINEDDYC